MKKYSRKTSKEKRKMINSFYEFLKQYNPFETETTLEIIQNGHKIIIDKLSKSFSVEGGIKSDHRRIFDLSKQENWSVVILLLKLFKQGYHKDVIHLEKCWQLGHGDSGYLDVMLTDPTSGQIYMIEVKTAKELKSYINISKPKKLQQLLSYAMQEKKTKLVSYYSYNFDEKVDIFYNIFLDDILDIAANTEDLFDRWNKTFDRDDFITVNPVFNVRPKIVKFNDLCSISEDSTKQLYNQFITILRLNSVSDKPNAFNKMINLFLAKIVAESEEDVTFEVIDKNKSRHQLQGLRFQYIPNLDTPVSFMKRLNELYKKGMEKYLNKDVIDYSDKEVQDILNSSNEEIWEMVDNLRLKKNINFSFIEVYDNDTFIENFGIVRDIVKLLQSHRFQYNYKQQFLGDFFENLLNTSLKQEAGQFFTPYPLVDFITNSIPFDKIILDKIENKEIDVIPATIDYACGAGHFLISAMDVIQKSLEKINTDNLSNYYVRILKAYKDIPYHWVSKENIVGIEKDYRLAKTTKIATFLNGDGVAEIISGDGINKFSSKDYKNTVLSTDSNILKHFDVIVSNPPYSVKGFMYNLQKNNIIPNDGTFSLLKQYKFDDTMIETYFVERAWQLLKDNAVAAIILPQSVLSAERYENLREYILTNFQINAMLLTSDITFLGTTTSPVVLFLTKKKVQTLNYTVMVIFSDKYFNIKAKKTDEERFLGYKFSTNRNKSGTETLKGISKLQMISPLLYDFLDQGTISPTSDELRNNVQYIKLKDLIIRTGESKLIFPKYKVADGVSLNELNAEINPETRIDSSSLEYVEISGIKNGTITTSDKDKSSFRICLKNDILISSVVPSKGKIILADQAYKVSTAIYVIRIKDDEVRKKVFAELKKEYAIKQMHSLLEGFKLTYSKIDDDILFNYVKLNVL